MRALREWEPLGREPPSTLADARLTLHWAAQIVAAAGATLLGPKPDDSHASLTWVHSARCLAGEPLTSGMRASLVVDDLALALIGPDDRLVSDLYSLEHRTLAEGLAWLGEAIGRADDRSPTPLERPRHDMPPHPVAQGGSFEGGARSRRSELARWYANADFILREVAMIGGSNVRCWPHHFDIGTSIPSVDKRDVGLESIGVGLSPGDASYDEPYWYVTPWPYPEPPIIQTMPTGHWHSSGWVGAVLPASELLAIDPLAQADAARSFIELAMSILNGAPR